MDPIEYLYDYKGYKIRLEADEVEYEGIIKDVFLDSRKLALLKVKMVKPREFVFSDMQWFYSRDIKSYSILSETQENIKSSSKKKIKHPFQPAFHFKKDFILDDISDYGGDCDTEKDLDSISDIVEEEYFLELPQHLRRRLPADHVIIRKVDKTFREAIDHISNECIIGVSFEGPNIGRNGKLYWIGVSTRACTYLFDIESLGDKAFTSGLKGIMESFGIMRVIHDCRQPSDSLQHQYNTTLRHVFDTQLADAFVSMQFTGQISDKVRPLCDCARSYLDLDIKDIYTPFPSRNGVYSEWDQPMENELLDRIIKDVIYLRLLKEELIHQMLKPFCDATDVFLNVVRNSSQKELQLIKPSVPHLMPECVLSAGLQVLQVKTFKSTSNESIYSQQFNALNEYVGAAQRLRPVRAPEKCDEVKQPNQMGKPNHEKICKTLPNEHVNVIQEVETVDQRNNIKRRMSKIKACYQLSLNHENSTDITKNKQSSTVSGKAALRSSKGKMTKSSTQYSTESNSTESRMIDKCHGFMLNNEVSEDVRKMAPGNRFTESNSSLVNSSGSSCESLISNSASNCTLSNHSLKTGSECSSSTIDSYVDRTCDKSNQKNFSSKFNDTLPKQSDNLSFGRFKIVPAGMAF